MSFNSDVSNAKLKGPDEQNSNYAVSALKALNRKGVKLEVQGSSLPIAQNITSGHLQGVAVPNGRVLLTSSVGEGYVMNGRRTGMTFTIEQAAAVQASHPGGIQAVGAYFPVPVSTDDGGSEIRFYSWENGIKRLGFTISRKRKASCVGITNCRNATGEFYIMAVGVSKNEFDFYKSKPGVPLGQRYVFLWTTQGVEC